MAYIFDDDKSKIPVDDDLQAQVDSLATRIASLSILEVNAAAGAVKKFRCRGYTRATIFVQSANGAANGIVNVNCENGTTVTPTKIAGATNQYIEWNIDGTFKITNSSGSIARYEILCYNGSIEEW